uniref:Uncharacterized protein n=1 Tax=Chromera velia CCMP2878 TaxID=1169474 RepID=A0A0G4GPA2_9ALVE|eukprot:Cvel_5014.t1-p1 / transcript=Cvel_5014.t1 / gene=Cvel_5014 / organism=Chromera_velia_CCMP2878 / gene_product=hypothetical protein / transcript_product=hypothetical protein / location=Cvel_scaffold227:98435-100573(+) / protein_length=270 / sequence_SO=supercontig / SO=protein_coding / is_pseudo=false
MTKEDQATLSSKQKTAGAKPKQPKEVVKAVQQKASGKKKEASSQESDESNPFPNCGFPFLDPEVKLDTKVESKRRPLPKRDPKTNELIFEDHPEFRPNLTPKEVLRRGSFGGTYFRSIPSGVTGKKYQGKEVIKELPADWFHGMSVDSQLCSQKYREAANRFGVKCGQTLDQWESSGWIKKQDPYGAFQWYCRFYLGRRSSDDKRQISRFNGVMRGRFSGNLIRQIVTKGRPYNDAGVSPVIRQTLQHWGYVLTERDFKKYCKSKGLRCQ